MVNSRSEVKLNKTREKEKNCRRNLTEFFDFGELNLTMIYALHARDN